jgi:hypothetical protein
MSPMEQRGDQGYDAPQALLTLPRALSIRGWFVRLPVREDQ